MIDLHSHIAWGIDDGLDTREQAVQVLDQARTDGIQTIASTPHFTPGESDPAILKARQEELAVLAQREGIRIVRASEVLMNDLYIEELARREYPTYENTDYLLVEFDVFRDLKQIENHRELLYETRIAGYKPVIAHIERYFKEGLDLDLIREWKQQGCVLQINRSSLNGSHGKTNEKNCRKLLKEGLVDVVATDTHRTDGTRIMKLSDARKILTDLCGADNARLLLEENPARILANQPVLDMEPVKKSWKFWK